MSTCDIPKSAMSLTIQISKSANPVTIAPSTAATLGNKNDNIIFKYPTVKIRATSGKTATVQMLVNGLIV